MKPVVIIAIAVVFGIGLSVSSISAQSQYEIPSWVKGVANFWAEGNIGDAEFGEAISFLIEQNIIKVEVPSEDLTELEEKFQSMRNLKDRYQQSMIELKEENEELKEEILFLKGLLGHSVTVPKQTSPPPEPTLSQEEINERNYRENAIVDKAGRQHIEGSMVGYDLMAYGLFEYEGKKMLRFDFEVFNGGSPFTFEMDNVVLESCITKFFNNCYEIPKPSWVSNLYEVTITGSHEGIILFEFEDDDCLLFDNRQDNYDRDVTWKFTQYHDTTLRTLEASLPLVKPFC